MNLRNAITTIILLLTISFTQAQSYVQIGNGTASSSVPYTAWNYSWSKALYNSADLGEAKTISKISLQSQNLDGSLPNQKIYLKHTTNSTTSASYDDPASAGYTLVYDGSISGTPESWNEIDINDFEYNGTDNLMLYFHSEHGSSSYNNFYATEISEDLVKVAGADNAIPTSSGFNPYPNALPNIRFYYPTSGPATPSNPQPAENTNFVSVETTLSFDLDANTTSFDVYFSSTESEVTNQEAAALVVDDSTISGAGTYTVDPSDSLLESKTTYYWQVVASDGSSTSTSPVWAFKTEKIISQFPYNQDFENSDVFIHGWYDPDIVDWDYYNEDNTSSWNGRASYAQSGDSCAYISPSFLEQDVDYHLQTPRMNLPAGSQISFWWFNGDSVPGGYKTSGVDSTVFQVSTDGGNTWNTLASLSPENAQEQYYQELISLSGYDGDNTYFRWVYNILDTNSYPKNVFLDNIEIKETSGEAEIALNTHNIDFNDIYLNGYNNQEVVITNNNLANELVITGVTTPQGFSCNYADTIAGGTSDTAVVYFYPDSAGEFSGDVTFEIDGNFSGDNTLTVNGTGLAPLQTVFEYFDDVPTDTIPADWHRIHDPDNQFHFVKVKTGVEGEYNSAPNVLRMYNSDEYNYPLMAIMPGVTNFNTNVLEFYAVKSAMDSLNLFVGLMENPFDAETFEVVDTITVQQDIAQYSVSFDTTNTKPYIAFAHGLNDSVISSIRIDDVVWKNPNTTNPPNAAGNLYPTDGQTAVDIMNNVPLKWTNEGGEPTGYSVSLGTNPEADNLINDLDVGDTTTYVFEDTMEYNTTYYWKVVAYNEDGEAENTAIWEFTTMADPVITSYPWSENFNNYIEHELPESNFRYPLGWSLENNNSHYYCWDKLANNDNNPTNAHSDSIAMHIINFSFSESSDDWMFTPPVQMEAGQHYEFSFWYKSTEYPGDATFERMEVKMGTDHSSEAMFNEPVFYDDSIVVREYTKFTTVITPDSSGEYYLGFHSFSDPMQWITHVDDVSIEEAAGGYANFTVNAEGAPLEGATISINNQDIETDANGEASVFLTNGEYNYTVTKDGYSEASNSITVSDADVDETVTLTPVYNVTFEVTDGANPVSGATVSLSGYGEQTTDANGEAVFSEVEPAEGIAYTVNADGYYETSSTIDVTDSDITESVTLDLQTYTVTFTIDDGTNPVAGATAELTGYGTQTTDDAGEAIFEDVTPESGITYAVSADNYHDTTGTVDVVDQDVTVSVSLDYTGITRVNDLTFNVYPNPGEGIFNVSAQGRFKVKVLTSSGKVIVVKTINSTGRIDLTDRAAGIYIIQLRSDDQFGVERLIVR